MRKPVFTMLTLAPLCLVALEFPASAQPAPYECVNESVDIDIRPQNMTSALADLSDQTHCPISQDTNLDGLRGNGVRGTYTPIEALKALVEDQGLEARSIRQGLSVSRKSTIAGQSSVPAYNCLNQSQRVSLKSMRLDDALAELSRQTRCPISKDFQTSGLLSHNVEGTMTPVKALRALLKGTGLGARQIRQGLAVTPVRNQ